MTKNQLLCFSGTKVTQYVSLIYHLDKSYCVSTDKYYSSSELIDTVRVKLVASHTFLFIESHLKKKFKIIWTKKNKWLMEDLKNATIREQKK